MSSNTSKTILLLAANPKGTTPLRLDEEVREIDAGLQRARQREQFVLEQKWAVRPRDIMRAMLDSKPSIVHFSGHGTGDEGLVFEDETGIASLVDGEALAGLFKLFAEQVKCVVLNACYSEVQAKAISQHIPYVIGTSQEISDEAAIAFAVGFYDALGAGESIEFAYELGRNTIHLAGSDEHIQPVLRKNAALLAETVSIIERIPASTTQTPHEETSETKWVLILNGTLDDDLAREQIETIIEHLRHLSGDASLKLDEIKSGSIILKLDGSEEGFKVIQSLYKEGKLTELLGLTVEYVGYENPALTITNSIIDVFFSYSHKDEELRNELANHLSILERHGVISGWCDR